MKEKNLKVKLLIDEIFPEEESGQIKYIFIDFYINTKYIKGFYIPLDDDDLPNPNLVNILYESMGQCSLQRNKELEDILISKFV